jgi:hypothetical protein
VSIAQNQQSFGIMFYELRNHGQGAFEKLSNNFRRAIRDAQPNYLGRIAINNASILKVGVSRNDREAIGFRVFPDRAVIRIAQLAIVDVQ